MNYKLILTFADGVKVWHGYGSFRDIREIIQFQKKKGLIKWRVRHELWLGKNL